MAGYGPPGSPPPPPGGYGAPQGGGYGPPPGGGYGPPPGGGYGSPGGYGAPSGGGVNLGAVNPLDWAAAGAGLLALIFSFFSFYTGKASATIGGRTVSQSAHESAWHGFFGWFAVLLALIGAALVLADVLLPGRVPFPARLAAIGAWALSLLFVIIAAFVTPDAKSGSDIGTGVKVDYGRGFGFWVVLLAIVVGTAVTVARFLQSGGSIPGIGGGSKGSGSGSGFGQPGGYAQPGYGAPQGPPPGYGQQPPQGPPPGYGQ
jgi:hypothetical protein